MQIGNLGVVERKLLGALLMKIDDEGIANISMQELAELMGYKATGGAMTFAIRILERDNFVVKLSRKKYRVLI